MIAIVILTAALLYIWVCLSRSERIAEAFEIFLEEIYSQKNAQMIAAYRKAPRYGLISFVLKYSLLFWVKKEEVISQLRQYIVKYI